MAIEISRRARGEEGSMCHEGVRVCRRAALVVTRGIGRAVTICGKSVPITACAARRS